MTIGSRSGVEKKPKVGKSKQVALNVFILLLAVAAYLQDQSAPSTQPASPAPEQSTSSAPSSVQATPVPRGEGQGSAPLRVMVDKSELINTTERISRVSVTDLAVASARVLAPGTQILVHGLSPGEISLIIWDEHGRSTSIDLRVDVDVSSCAEEENILFTLE